ncbi:MAG TPA: DMT family transporter [Candidatus Saccharimonadales bacterium]|nr:DMT family transporter [Candidatus Saccharimonadales bacterium]
MLNTPLPNVSIYITAWALLIFFNKLGFIEGANIFTFTLQSYFIAFILLGIFVLPRKWQEIKTIPFSIFLWTLLAGVVHVGIGSLLSQTGLQLTSAINAGFLMQFTTVTTTVLAWITLKEKMNISKIITIFIIISGTFLLVTKGQGLKKISIGDLAILLACICWSISAILTKKTLRHSSISPEVLSFFRPAVGIPILILFLIFSPLYPLPLRSIFHFDIFNFRFLPLVLLAGFCSVCVWVFSNRTLKVASASYLTMMNSTTPVLVTILALFFLKETIDRVQFLGIALILLGNLQTHYLKIEKH